MVKINRSPVAPASLAAMHSYRERDVIEQLIKDFHNKCYICEQKEPDVQVEHLYPHHNNKYPERVYDWNNLFLSCGHCNKVKNNRKYDDMIIDCCRVDPEEVLLFYLNEEGVDVIPRVKDVKAEKTADLIVEVFTTKSTGIKTADAENHLKKLQRTMLAFMNQVDSYWKDPSDPLTIRTIKAMVSRSAAFAGFTRCFARSHGLGKFIGE